jgi:hypothetical protein
VKTIRKYQVPKGSCHTGRYLKDNDDMVAIGFAYDKFKTLFQMELSVLKARTVQVLHAQPIGHDDVSASYAVDRLVLNTAPYKLECHGYL